MQKSQNHIEKVLQESKLKTNKKLMKVLACRREKRAAYGILKGERFEQVESFTCLGRIIAWNGRSTSNVRL
jgi:adenylyl- and sulfurtransferase ThiI